MRNFLLLLVAGAVACGGSGTEPSACPANELQRYVRRDSMPLEFAAYPKNLLMAYVIIQQDYHDYGLDICPGNGGPYTATLTGVWSGNPIGVQLWLRGVTILGDTLWRADRSVTALKAGQTVDLGQIGFSKTLSGWNIKYTIQ